MISWIIRQVLIE